MSELIVIGRLISVYGLKGWLKIRSYTEPPENLFTYQPWLLNTLRGIETSVVDQWRRHHKGFIAKIVGIDDCQQAKSLYGTDILVEKTHLPALDKDEYYWHQLQGLRVISTFNNEDIYLGRVKELIPTGANDVLVIETDANSTDQRQRLVPYVVDRHVKKVDLDNGVIYVDWDPEF